MKMCVMFSTISWSRKTPQSEVISENYNVCSLQSAGAEMLLQLTAAIREKAWTEWQ